jgi:hypothetical protein
MLCSEGHLVVSCVKMEKVEFHLDDADKPQKIIAFTPHERFISQAV